MTLPQLQIIQQVNRAMQCSACGVEGIAACDCGAPYLPAPAARAANAIAANPSKSDRAIAADLGIGKDTVRRARPTGAHAPVDTRVGRDGKIRQMPKRKKIKDEVMPTEEEADKSWQSDLYDHACLLVERMAGDTRQRFFAHLRRKYDVK